MKSARGREQKSGELVTGFLPSLVHSLSGMHRVGDPGPARAGASVCGPYGGAHSRQDVGRKAAVGGRESRN